MLHELLRAPVPSDRGLGIGLFQSAQQAQALGFALQVRDNRDGGVCLVLKAVQPHANPRME
jgi:hypothetical protein